ncbi:MAG: DUF721 domain-containing protein [Candidatus Dormibacteraeota bacterium]|nr:DUF721 domain-containing protein [Candidatus Dormibacteraeota bacterium]
MGKVLENVLARWDRPGPLLEAGLRAALPAVLGEELASRCEEPRVEGDTLCMSTGDQALAQQLRRDSGELLRLLDQRLHLGGRLRRVRVSTTVSR